VSQLRLGDEEKPALGRNQADVLGGTILGFAAPGRWESGAKVPPKVRATMAEVAAEAVAEARRRLDVG